VLPPPPPELCEYVGERDREDPVGSFLHASEVLGGQLAAALPGGLDFGDGRVLDFGCGAGRLLRYLLENSTAGQLEGCDIDERCIAWLSARLPAPHQVFRCGELPPLARPDGHYRLIYATSVFSHLAGTWAQWLSELHRVLEPGGLLVASVISADHAEAFGEAPWDDARIGMLVLGPGNPWSAGGPIVLHSRWWLEAHWGRAFEILSFGERLGGEPPALAQSLVVMRRRERSVTPELLEHAQPDEPRELRALEHALRRSHAESVELNAGHNAYSEAYTEEARLAGALRDELAAAREELAATTANVAELERELASARRARRAPALVAGALAARVRLVADRLRHTRRRG
jgi:SAM-dependent methyltransferase